MARLFGTDGIRGVANVDLRRRSPTPSAARPPIAWSGRAAPSLVGQDTRRSGDMFVAAIAAGATSLGSMSTTSASCRRRRSPT